MPQRPLHNACFHSPPTCSQLYQYDDNKRKALSWDRITNLLDMSTASLYHMGIAEYDPRECKSTKYKVSWSTTILADSTHDL